MRGCFLTLTLFILILIGFIAGAVTTQPGLMIAGFFLSPFILFAGGWTARGLLNGRRIALVEVERRSPSVSSTSQRRERLQAETRDRAAQETL